MTITGAIVLYATVWFLVMFLLIPFGRQSQADMGEVTPGTPAGAPARTWLRKQALWATVISALIWLGAAWFLQSGIITRDDILNFGRPASAPSAQDG
ncbi:MAG: DUF1467 family protein [Paracoccus sp. (in: a-proteobacteria)]|uniref:DUF1467 family protein n=1 Tax=Paracoccus sp. TaxID=267 RepID=UPI0026DF559C|nr:DUF1467 family protein [Paracoccus sp. (in: a-proteobacteria)]MDO5621813.1 DUF1467 family protein [Paracoccus sp. (in: a-proteobacteria)]